jgi:hypothetical protein
MGRGGGEGRVPSLMTAAVEREVSNSCFFFFSLMCRPWGIRLKRERNEVCINPKGISPWVTLPSSSLKLMPNKFRAASLKNLLPMPIKTIAAVIIRASASGR